MSIFGQGFAQTLQKTVLFPLPFLASGGEEIAIRAEGHTGYTARVAPQS